METKSAYFIHEQSHESFQSKIDRSVGRSRKFPGTKTSRPARRNRVHRSLHSDLSGNAVARAPPGWHLSVTWPDWNGEDQDRGGASRSAARPRQEAAQGRLRRVPDGS